MFLRKRVLIVAMQVNVERMVNMKLGIREFRCCLCGKVCTGYGNNPYPLALGHNRCCDVCNTEKVIPARISEYNRMKDKAEEEQDEQDKSW